MTALPCGMPGFYRNANGTKQKDYGNTKIVTEHALTVSKVFKMLKLDTIKQKDYGNTKIVTEHALTVSKVFMKMLKQDTI